MKKQLFMAALFLLAVGMSSCSVDSHDNPVDKNEQGAVTSTDYSVSVDYHLENAKGVETTTFKEGENIVFSLSVANNGKLDLTQLRDPLVGSAMMVYDSDGRAVGTPLYAWGEDVEEVLHWFVVRAGSRTYWRVPWIYDASLLESNDETFRLSERERVGYLKPGRYYTELIVKFSVYIEGKEECIADEMRRIDFIVE